MMLASALLLMLACLTSSNAQLTSGYSTEPFYVQTFDVAPSALQVNQSGGGFTWVRDAAGRKGAAYLDRSKGNYIDLNLFADNYNRTIPSFGDELSIEMWMYDRDVLNRMVILDFAIAPINAAGIVTGRSTSDRIALRLPVTQMWYEVAITNRTAVDGVQSSIITTGNDDSFISGTWVHVAVTVARNATATSLGTNNAAITSLYLNGVLVSSGPTFLPRNVIRSVNWIGKSSGPSSGSGTDPAEHMFVDSFAAYSYPLSAEAIFAHMQTSRPPRFELTFGKNPTILTGETSPTYVWLAADEFDTNIRGVVRFQQDSGQSINLLTSSGRSSVGTSMPADLNGGGGLTWTYVITLQLNTLAGSTIFDFKGDQNRVRLSINSYGYLEFSENGVITTSSVAFIIPSWHTVVVVMSETLVTIIQDGQQVGFGVRSPRVRGVFTRAFIGQSADDIPQYTRGSFDAFRIYDIALTSAEVSALYKTLRATPTKYAEEMHYAPAPQTSPVVSYTFGQNMPEFGVAGMTNFTHLNSVLDRSGMAFFDGSNEMIQLKEFPDDHGRLIPTYFGGAMSFEFWFQFLSSTNEAVVFGFSGPRSVIDTSIQLGNTYSTDGVNINSLVAEMYGDRTISKRTATYCSGCTNGSWAHGMVTIAQRNTSDSTSASSATITLYVNGILVSSKNGWLPPLAYRPNMYLGKSDNPTESLFYGNIDSFHWYNYEVPAEAVAAHFALPLPPLFETVFAYDPRAAAGGVSTAAYSWIEGENAHTGLISLGLDQCANLSATSGPNFIGFTMPAVTGSNRNTTGVEARFANGWAVEVTFSAASVATGVTVFDIAAVNGSNALTLQFTAAGQLSFVQSEYVLPCGPVTVNAWVHVVVVIVQDGTTMEGQCYMDGERGPSATNYPPIPVVARNSVLLGKANTRSAQFIGLVDVFRVMEFGLTSEDAMELYAASNSAERVVDAPAYQSGPIGTFTFDREPLPQNDPTGSPTYNFYNWQYESSGYFANPNRTGLAVLEPTGTSAVQREYVDMNFDGDAYGKTLPQTWGGSMSVEMWVNLASPLVPFSRMFDCGDDLNAGIGTSDGEKSFNIWLGISSARGLRFANYYTATTQTTLDVTGISAATWTHIVGVIEQTSSTVAQMRVYINGVLRGSVASKPPPVRMRRRCFLGRSNWAADPALKGVIDSLHVYNYPLTVPQINMHLSLPNVAHFDADFDESPAQMSSPAYGWTSGAVNGTTRGRITFNGVNQYVSLNAGSGNTSIGQSFPNINGPSVGVGQDGFSIELSCMWNNLTSNSKVFDIGNGRGVDSVAIGNQGNNIVLFTHNGITDSGSVTELFTAEPNVFYHFIVVGAPSTIDSSLMRFSLYHGGRLVSSVENKVAPLYMSRRRAFLARSNTAGDSYFAGAIDLLRYYTYAVKPESAQYLFELQGTSGAYIPPVPVVVSSSSTGSAQPSSSSQPSSSAEMSTSQFITSSSSSDMHTSATSESSSAVQSSTAMSSSVVSSSSSSTDMSSSGGSSISSSVTPSTGSSIVSSSSLSSSSLPSSSSSGSSVSSASSVPSSSSSSPSSSSSSPVASSSSSSSVPVSSSSSPVSSSSTVSSSSMPTSSPSSSSSSSSLSSSGTSSPVSSSSVPSSSSHSSSSSIPSSSSSVQSSSSISSSVRPSSSSSSSSSSVPSSTVTSSTSTLSSSSPSSSSSIRSSSSSSSSSVPSSSSLPSSSSSSSRSSSSSPSSSSSATSSIVPSSSSSSPVSSTAQSSSAVSSSVISSTAIASSSSSSPAVSSSSTGSPAPQGITLDFHVVLPSGQNPSNFINPLLNDIAATIARMYNVQAQSVRPHLSLSFGSSSANRRLLQQSQTASLVVYSTINTVVSDDATGVTNSVSRSVASGTLVRTESDAAGISVPTTDTTPTPEPESSSSSSLSSGAIAGIVIGVVAGVVLIGLFAFFMCSGKHIQKSAQREGPNDSDASEVEAEPETGDDIEMQNV